MVPIIRQRRTPLAAITQLQKTPPHQLVLFRVGGTHYGFDIEAVDEILPLLTITPLPGAPRGILGLADVRKRVVPVLDLHVKFNVPPPDSNHEARLILVDCGQSQVAMLVDAVEEVVTVSRDDFQQVATPGNDSEMRYLSGVLRRGDNLTLWVDHVQLAPEGLERLKVAA